MTTVFYKKILGNYEISEICESTGNGARLEFEEPIDGKIVILSSVFDLSRGVCNIKASHLPEGDLVPKLYTGGDMQKIEGFIHKLGAIIRKTPDADYARRLAVTVDALFSRVQGLEAVLDEMKNKIERKITF